MKVLVIFHVKVPSGLLTSHFFMAFSPAQAAGHLLAFHHRGSPVPANMRPGGARLNGSVQEDSFSVACASEGATEGAAALMACAEFSEIDLQPGVAMALAQDAEQWVVKLFHLAVQLVGSWERVGIKEELRPLGGAEGRLAVC